MAKDLSDYGILDTEQLLNLLRWDSAAADGVGLPTDEVLLILRVLAARKAARSGMTPEYSRFCELSQEEII